MNDQDRRLQMVSGFFVNRWFIGGVGFLILLAVTCVLWFHYDTAPYRKNAAESAQLIQQWKKSKQTNKNNKSNENNAGSPNNTTLSDAKPSQNTNDPDTKLKNGMSPATTDGAAHGSSRGIASLEDMATTQEDLQDALVSPHGFGTFPNVPQGFPANIRIPWQWEEVPYSASKELAVRVLIKLWEQGDTSFTGVQYTDDYKIYPHYPNTAYVKYSFRTSEDGTTVRSISSFKGGPDLPEITPEMMFLGVIPGVQLISEEQGGIDALDFLNLE